MKFDLMIVGVIFILCIIWSTQKFPGKPIQDHLFNALVMTPVAFILLLVLGMMGEIGGGGYDGSDDWRGR